MFQLGGIRNHDVGAGPERGLIGGRSRFWNGKESQSFFLENKHLLGTSHRNFSQKMP
jgi:hypothetical protein